MTSATMNDANRARIAAMAGAIADRLEAEHMAEIARNREIAKWVQHNRMTLVSTNTLDESEATKVG
jgi:hypothetical protein